MSNADELKLYEQLAGELPPAMDVDIFNRLDRNALATILRDYFHCENVMQMMVSLIRCLLQQASEKHPNEHFLYLTLPIQNLLTQLRLLSTDTTQGITMTTGIQYLDRLVLLKYDYTSDKNLAHEIVTGLLLNKLRKFTPCFMYVYGGFKCGSLESVDVPELQSICHGIESKDVTIYMLAEYIQGHSLRATMNDPEFEPIDLIKVFYMIAWSMNLAKEKFDFGHYDLHSDNIIIRKLKTPQLFIFGKVRVSTRFVPVIIDYGGSQFTTPGGYTSHANFYIQTEKTIEAYDVVKMILYCMSNRRMDMKQLVYDMLKESQLYNMLNPKDKSRAKKIFDTGEDDDDFWWYPSKPLPDFKWMHLLNYLEIKLQDYPVLDFQTEIKCLSNDDILSNTFPMRNCELDSMSKFTKSGDAMILPGCSNLAFDGSYNVVSITKGTKLYHGTNKVGRYRTPNLGAKKDKYVSSITALNPLPVAIEKSRCDDCVLAFKFVERGSFIHLGDALNLKRLLGDMSILSNDEKQMLAIVYGFDPKKDVMVEWVNNIKIESDNIRSPIYACYQILLQRLVKIANEQGYAGVVILDRNVKAEFWMGDNINDYVQRDYSNIYDWQYVDLRGISNSISSLIEDMSNYKTSGGQHHSGNVLEHSMWTALYMQRLIRDFSDDISSLNNESSQWIEGIKGNNFRPLLAACFLHDIGKGGDNVLLFDDKVNHPDKGAGYILGTEKYKMVDNVGILNFDLVLKEMGVYEFRNVIAVLIQSHQLFGKVMKGELNIKKFVSEMKVRVEEKMRTSPKDFRQIMLMTMALTAADVMAARMFEVEERGDDIVNEYPFITNRGKKQKGRNTDMYLKYDYEKKGLKLRKKVLEMIE